MVAETVRVSPHTRGWTLDARLQSEQLPGFPAHAGMDPGDTFLAPTALGFPRTRGDGPPILEGQDLSEWVSPHTRGWTPFDGLDGETLPGFPAHAGMDPEGAVRPGVGRGFPRTRGDGPAAAVAAETRPAVSPHTRGWTPEHAARDDLGEGFPAHAGMDRGHGNGRHRRPGFPRTRGDGPFPQTSFAFVTGVSPHTRGWTQVGGPRPGDDSGFPAHAGMDPSNTASLTSSRGFPRTRGDGPRHFAFLAPPSGVSPHTRGWTPFERRGTVPDAGFPAHAGMDPLTFSVEHDARRVSPHTRGWTRAQGDDPAGGQGFPAHAGMDPCRRRSRCSTRRFPRTRGDGPRGAWLTVPPPAVSPHTRGWTPPPDARQLLDAGFPAHAGMDP